MSAVTASGQNPPILKPIVTDQTPLPLSNLFQATTGRINQVHDFAFAPSDGSALFLRRAADSAPARIIQRGDAVPGVPGSWLSGISTPIYMTEPKPGSKPGMVVFQASLFVSGSSRSGIFAYDGTSIRSLVFSTDVAPGSGGLLFTDLQLLGVNDNGDIAFRALATKNAESLFILPAGESPVRVVGKGDTLRETAGPVSGFSLPASINARGEIAFSCDLSGGNGQVIVVGSTSELRKIASTGDPAPGGGTLRDFSFWLLLNNSGAVVFQSQANYGVDTTWINTPGIGTEKLQGVGRPLALNDSGQVLFTTDSGLFRTKIDHSIETVAEVGQTAPGTSGRTFASFKSVMNSSGDVAFVGWGDWDHSSHPLGVFQKSGTDQLKALALNGDPAGFAGGTLDFRNTSLTILGDGSVQFSASVAGGADDSAQLLSTASGLQTLVSTADPLPAGARVSLLNMGVPAAGNYVGFAAEFNGGRRSLFIEDVISGSTTLVATSGGPAPGTNGSLRLDGTTGYFVNSRGQAALITTVAANGSQNDAPGVFLSDPVNGLQKIAVAGDIEAITGLRIGTILNLGSWHSGSFFNSNGQVAFAASFGSRLYGLLVGSVDAGVKKVILTGDRLPDGGTFPDIWLWSSKTFFINNAGRVAFSSGNPSSYTPQGAVFTAAPGEAVARIVTEGDAGPLGAFYSLSEPLALNDNGQVVFSAYTGGTTGLFLGKAGSTPQTIALAGQTAPGEDGLSFGPLRLSAGYNGGVINNAGTVAFPALLAGSSDSGFFLKSGTDSKLKAVFLQGQTVPGTSEAFGPVFGYPPSYGLDDSGFFYALNEVGNANTGLVRYRPNGVLEKVLVTGETAPDGGGTVVRILPPYYSAAVSKPPFWVGLVGGAFSEAIYVPLLPALQTDTSALSFISVDGANPETQSLTISNAGVEDLNWTASASNPWISLDATSGNAPSTVKVSVDASGLSLGVHHGTITLTCGAADGSPKTVDVTVAVQSHPGLTWSTPSSIAYGTPLSATQLSATASVPGTFTYTPDVGTVLGVGRHTLSVTFSPTDTTKYRDSTGTVELLVYKSTPTVHWSTPADITVGTALSEQQLNATADIPGTFVYTPAAGTVLEAGTYSLVVAFTPTDTTNYATSAQKVRLTVNKLTPTITWAAPAAFTYGKALTEVQLNATADVAGTFVYSPTAGTVLGAGTRTLSVTFTPADTAKYTVASSAVQLTVDKATPILSWSTPAAITSGTVLGDAQLSATASIPGTFVYTPLKGTVPEVGTQTLTVRFTPTDTTNYTEATASVSLKVNAPEVVTPVITGLTPALVKAGSSGFNLVVSGTGFGAGATVLWNGSARTTTVVSGGLQAEITAADIASPGTVNVTVANPASLGGAVSAQYKFVIDTAAAASGGFTVTVPTTVTVEPGKDTQVAVTLAGVSASATVTATCVNLPSGVSYSYKDGVLTFTTSPSTPPGTYTIIATFTSTTQSAALRRSSNRYFALWLGFGGLPLGLLWAGGRFRRNAARCGMVVGGLLLIAMLASCGGGSTASNPSGSPSTPTAPVSKQSSVVMTLTVR